VEEAGVPALRTGAVAGRQGRRLVQEKQFGVTARCHDLAPAAPELQHAHDPPPQLPRPPDVPCGALEGAPVAHEGAPVGGGDEVAERGDAVLPRHLRPSSSCQRFSVYRAFLPVYWLPARIIVPSRPRIAIARKSRRVESPSVGGANPGGQDP